MSNWPVCRLGDLAASTDGAVAIGPFGSAMKADTYSPSGVPVIRGMNISDTRSWHDDWVFVPHEFADGMTRCNVFADDLVFPHRGSIGEVAIVPHDFHRRYMLSTSLMKISLDKKKANPLFVYYYFRSAAGRHEILKFSSQVGTPGIGQPLTSLRLFELPVPDLPQQDAIASILAALDDKIALNRAMSQTLEAMARGVFRDWFVDFGPSHGRSGNRHAYLAPDVWARFADRFGAHDIPAGWSQAAITEVADVNSEAWSEREHPGQVDYVDLANTKWGSIDSTVRYQWADAPSRARRVLRPGDTIVGTVRPGNGSYALVDRDGLTGSTGFAVLRPKHPSARTFVYCAATSNDNIDRLSHLADGAAYPAVRPDVVGQTEIVLPETHVLEAFEAVCGPLIDQDQCNKRENRALVELRDLLLPKLMSGRVVIRDAEKLVGEAV